MMVRITSGGIGVGDTTIVTEDGDDITNCVRAASWRASSDEFAEVTLELAVVPIDAAGKVKWRGLEKVPAEALEAELQRRAVAQRIAASA